MSASDPVSLNSEVIWGFSFHSFISSVQDSKIDMLDSAKDVKDKLKKVMVCFTNICLPLTRHTLMVCRHFANQERWKEMECWHSHSMYFSQSCLEMVSPFVLCLLVSSL